MILAYHNQKYHVWEGSLSFSYFEPPSNSTSFNEEDDAWEYARKLESEMSICEGGVQRLSQIEIIEALRQEVEMLRNPSYCPECDACGEEGCCPGSLCKKNSNNKCLYGETYALDYDYNHKMTNELYEQLVKHDKASAERIQGEVWDSIYGTK